jgi:hypothetical protein
LHSYFISSVGGIDLEIKQAQLAHEKLKIHRETLINQRIIDGDQTVFRHVFENSTSSGIKNSGSFSAESDDGPPNVVFNYGSMLYSADPFAAECDDNSKYFKLLKHFGTGYRFSKSGAECCVMKKDSVVPLFLFPYTINDLRNACFLFMAADNLEERGIRIGKGYPFEDCSAIVSPPEFRIHDR